MKLPNIKRGFTLIELLVVITIIGILATGATTVYTSQIQKARDTTRINDLKALQSGIEQIYQDNSEYPHVNFLLLWDPATSTTWLKDYMESIPSDSKFAQPCNAWGVVAWTDCWYTYVTAADANGILYWVYEIATAFEAVWNVDKKAKVDWWQDNTRYEAWLSISSLDTSLAKDAVTWNPATTSNWACLPAGWIPGSWTAKIVINWDWTCS